MKEKIKVRARNVPYYDGIEVVIRKGDKIVEELQFSKQINLNEVVLPSFRLEFSEAQALMDDLWTAGLRPTESKHISGELKAITNHLEDFRKITFRLLDLDK